MNDSSTKTVSWRAKEVQERLLKESMPLYVVFSKKNSLYLEYRTILQLFKVYQIGQLYMIVIKITDFTKYMLLSQLKQSCIHTVILFFCIHA